MDGQRFDTLVRTLATSRSRRSLIRTALATVTAGLGTALGMAEASAGDCKRAGKQCKKNSQCCSGVCSPPSNSTSTAGSDSVCCDPEPNAVTCDGQCGDVVNNCGQVIQCQACCTPIPRAEACAGNCEQDVDDGCGGMYRCGLCADEICVEEDECNSGECCQGSCCDEDRSPTAACCPDQGRCCECFQDNSPGGGGRTFCDCPSHRELCGTYPNDQCCLPQDTCIDGECVPDAWACPAADNPDGPNVDCRSHGAGCCNGVCCPAGTTCDAHGQCVAELPVCSADDPCTDGGFCTAMEGRPEGICCPGNRYYEFEAPSDEGTIIVRDCCTLGREARGCDDAFCTEVQYDGCSATFRGTQPRITS